jgi:hypothetical protein
MFSVKDAQEAVRIFLERRPASVINFSQAFGGDHDRVQIDSADAQPAKTLANALTVEALAPTGARGSGAEDEVGGDDVADIEAVLSQQICDMKKLQMDANDPHRAAIISEIVRLERVREELIENEKLRQKLLLACVQAASDAMEQKRLQDAACLLQQGKEQRLREEREKQELSKKLRRMGNCPNGYAWTKTSTGYVCEGGAHHVTDAQLHS